MANNIKLPQRCKKTVLLDEKGLLTCKCGEPWERIKGRILGYNRDNACSFIDQLDEYATVVVVYIHLDPENNDISTCTAGDGTKNNPYNGFCDLYSEKFYNIDYPYMSKNDLYHPLQVIFKISGTLNIVPPSLKAEAWVRESENITSPYVPRELSTYCEHYYDTEDHAKQYRLCPYDNFIVNDCAYILNLSYPYYQVGFYDFSACEIDDVALTNMIATNFFMKNGVIGLTINKATKDIAYGLFYNCDLTLANLQYSILVNCKLDIKDTLLNEYECCKGTINTAKADIWFGRQSNIEITELDGDYGTNQASPCLSLYDTRLHLGTNTIVHIDTLQETTGFHFLEVELGDYSELVIKNRPTDVEAGLQIWDMSPKAHIEFPKSKLLAIGGVLCNWTGTIYQQPFEGYKNPDNVGACPTSKPSSYVKALSLYGCDVTYINEHKMINLSMDKIYNSKVTVQDAYQPDQSKNLDSTEGHHIEIANDVQNSTIKITGWIGYEVWKISNDDYSELSFGHKNINWYNSALHVDVDVDVYYRDWYNNFCPDKDEDEAACGCSVFQHTVYINSFIPGGVIRCSVKSPACNKPISLVKGAPTKNHCYCFASSDWVDGQWVAVCDCRSH